MKKNIYLVYKLPIWVCVFTVVALVTLISCHNATVNPPSIELIRNSLKNNFNASFSLNNLYLGDILKVDNSIILKFDEPQNISNILCTLNDNSIEYSFDDLSFDMNNISLIKNNNLYRIYKAINSIYLDNNAEVSRWNDTVKVKTCYDNNDYKIYFDKDLNITNIKSDELNFSIT